MLRKLDGNGVLPVPDGLVGRQPAVVDHLHVAVHERHQVDARMWRTELLLKLPYRDLTVRHALGGEWLQAVVPRRRTDGIVLGIAGEMSHHCRVGSAIGIGHGRQGRRRARRGVARFGLIDRSIESHAGKSDSRGQARSGPQTTLFHVMYCGAGASPPDVSTVLSRAFGV